MVEAVVTFLLQNLQEVLNQNVGLLQNYHKDIRGIKDEFQSIHAFLKDADAKEETDYGVEAWVEQVRNVAFEIENVLDELHVLSQPRRHGGYISGIPKRFTYLYEDLSAKRRIGTQIKDIKARIHEIFNRRERYNLSNSTEQSSPPSTSNPRRDPREDALFLEEDQLVNIQGPREELIGYLLEADTRLGVVSVFGMGGLGKTTLVKKVYDSASVREHFQYRAWVTVSQEFELRSLLADLFKQFFPQHQGVEMTMHSTKLKELLNDNLRGKRYLVVLDDTWNLRDWEDLRNLFPNDNRSRILVTTRSHDLARKCIQDYGHSYSLQPLNVEDSQRLFYKKAFKSNPDENSCWERHCQNFLKLCKGVPLAIVSIAGLLSTKDPSEWDHVYQNLGSLMEHQLLNTDLVDLEQVFLFSYNDLPYNLKSCFLYTCIFPEDYAINCSRLIRLWSAVGFVERRRDAEIMSNEEIARGYLDQLIQRSLVQVHDVDVRGRVTTCKIHDLMREFIIPKARQQNFAEVFATLREYDIPESSYEITDFCYMPEAMKYGYMPETTTYGYMLEPRRPRHISILTEGDIGMNILSAFVNPHLHSFLLFDSKWRSSFYSKSTLVSHFKLLRVLDLENSKLLMFPSEVADLFHLKYLSLRGNYMIADLPKYVGKVMNLETLDLKYTSVHKLPVDILELKNLRNLFIGSRLQGMKLPVGIDIFSSLEKLAFVDADEGRNAIVNKLGMFRQLRRLAIVKLRHGDVTQLFASVTKMKYLRSLTVSLKDDEMLLSSNDLQPPPTLLRRLSIRGNLDTLPNWIPSLGNLEKLVLAYSRLNEDPLKTLQVLPSLVVLILDKAFDGENLCLPKGGFRRLKELYLMDLEKLNKVEVEQGAMPLIQSIAFVSCNKMEEVPVGIENLVTLKEIAKVGMPDSFMDQLSKHCWKTGHNPIVVDLLASQLKTGFGETIPESISTKLVCQLPN